MMNWLRRNRYTIFVATLGFFVVGIFGGLGANYFGDMAKANVIAEVNGKDIPYKLFARLLQRRLNDIQEKNPSQELSGNFMKSIEQEVLNELIREEVLVQEAAKYDIVVTDQELAMDIQRYPAFQKDGRFDRPTYVQALRRYEHITPAEFENSRRRQITILKLQDLIASSALVTDTEVQWDERSKSKKDKDTLDLATKRQNLQQEKSLWIFDQWSRHISRGIKLKTYLDRYQEGRSAS